MIARRISVFFLLVFLMVVTLNTTAQQPLNAPAPPESQPADEQPELLDPDNPIHDVLTYSPQRFDFGDIGRGDTKTGTVTITNTSDKPIRIVRTFSTCGCTVPYTPKDPIEPGKSVEVDIKFTGKNDGPSGSVVRFYFENQEGDVQVAVKAYVKPALEVEPKLFTVQPKEDEPMIIRSTDGEPFVIFAADPPVLEGIDEEPRTEHTLMLSASAMKKFDNRIRSIRLYVKHPRTNSIILKSKQFETSAQMKQLYEWARGNGEIDDIEKIIEAGADINGPDHRGMTALMFAALGKNTERMRLLMEYGADIHATRNDGSTALIDASKSPHGVVDSVALLLEAGADVNIVDRFNRSALFWAARSGDAARINALIEAGAELEIRGPFEETPLMSAARSTKLENIQALVEAGADLNAVDAKQMTALDHVTKLIATSPAGIREERQQIANYLESQMN